MVDTSTNPTTVAPRRFSVRLRRLVLIGLAAVVLIVVAAGLWIGIPAYRQQAAIWERYRPGAELSGLPSHPLDQRREELEALIADVERGQTLTKKDVVSRLGKPDLVEGTGSKDFADRTISTTYNYDLAPGVYLFPNSERANIGSEWFVVFWFDERVKHGKGGRLYSVVDDTVTLGVVRIGPHERSRPIFTFPTTERTRYKLPGE